MDIYQTEDEQVEAIKKWWEENGKSAIFGVVLGLAAIFGWREWQDHRLEQSESASALYQQMISAARENNSESLSTNADELSTKYKDTTYAVFAKLALAKIAVRNGELDSAAEDLRWALDNCSQDSLVHVIKLRLIRVLIAQNKLSEADTMLSSSTDRGEFGVGYEELEADILRLEGNIEAARLAYQEALGMARSSGQDTVILDMKLDDLGRSEAQ